MERMNNTDDIEQQLWEYIDGYSNEAENRRIADLVANDAIWRAKYQELLALHQSLQTGVETEQPSLRFTKNVMDAISQTSVAPATKKYINYNILKGIAAFFILTLAAILVYAFAVTKWNSNGSPTLSLSNVHISNALSGQMVNVMLGINVILVLLLADMLLRRKMAHRN